MTFGSCFGHYQVEVEGPRYMSNKSFPYPSNSNIMKPCYSKRQILPAPWAFHWRKLMLVTLGN